jgi:hypothetical protein
MDLQQNHKAFSSRIGFQSVPIPSGTGEGDKRHGSFIRGDFPDAVVGVQL